MTWREALRQGFAAIICESCEDYRIYPLDRKRPLDEKRYKIYFNSWQAVEVKESSVERVLREFDIPVTGWR